MVTTDKLDAIKTAPSETELADLTSAHLRAKEHADALRTEAAGLPSLIDEAITTGDTAALADAKSRQAAIPDAITAADILTARCRVALLEARHRKVRSEEAEARKKAHALHEELAAFKKRLGLADMEAAANGAERSAVSMDLRNAERHLEALIADAKTSKRSGHGPVRSIGY